MRISEIVDLLAESLAKAFPDAEVTHSKTITRAIERVASPSGKPVITLTPGRRDAAQLAGNLGEYGGVAKQQILIYVGALAGIAKRGKTQLALADLVAEVETAALNCGGDWTDPRWEGSEPAQLPDGYPLDAWLIRVSVTTSQLTSTES